MGDDEVELTPADDGSIGNNEGEESRGSDARPRVVPSEQLLQGRRELWIEHGGELYRLRVTSRGKLYLTK